MMFFLKNQLFVVIVVILTAIFGDYIVKTNEDHIKAISDNLTHAIIGGLSWILVLLSQRYSQSFLNSVLEIMLCTLIASFIDLDHFFAAKSIHLKDAMSLAKRPSLHSSTQPLFAAFVIIVVSIMWHSSRLQRFAFIILVAFGTHHTRDATRRGYWFAPFGSTKPIPYIFYIGLTVLIPYLAVFSMQQLSEKYGLGKFRAMANEKTEIIV